MLPLQGAIEEISGKWPYLGFRVPSFIYYTKSHGLTKTHTPLASCVFYIKYMNNNAEGAVTK